MPRGKPPLSDREVTIVKKWIEQGAKDDTPASAKLLVVDADHPPVYVRHNVINGLAFHKDGVLLGGTFERGEWDATPQPEDIARILSRHRRLFAGLRCAA